MRHHVKPGDQVMVGPTYTMDGYVLDGQEGVWTVEEVAERDCLLVRPGFPDTWHFRGRIGLHGRYVVERKIAPGVYQGESVHSSLWDAQVEAAARNRNVSRECDIYRAVERT